jgi:hypothetical protein
LVLDGAENSRIDSVRLLIREKLLRNEDTWSHSLSVF